MKIKKILSLGLIASLSLCVIGCEKNKNSKTQSEEEPKVVEPTKPQEGDQNEDVEVDKTDSDTTIFLAGDSTVKTYKDEQYIAGWGQYLDKFLTDNVTVKNCAHGGRSSRSFINEGRLYDIEGAKYTFSENGGNSIGDEIKEGDYLFIQFGHNDDDTKAANSLAERMVPLGTPDSNGIYPTTPGTKTTIVKDSSGNATLDSVSTEVKNKMSDYSSNLTTYLSSSVSKYGNDYYEYSSGGTYKWFLKQYIDFAREKKATPVLITPVARVSFNSDGTLRSGAGLHGDDFAYVKAVRQLASEEKCLMIDLFDETKTMLETATNSEAYTLMALKDKSNGNSNEGGWPAGFDTEYKDCVHENTHYNKFGSYLAAGKIAEKLTYFIENDVKTEKDEKINFKNSVLSSPEVYVSPSNLMHKETANKMFNLFSSVKVKDDNFNYPDPAIVENMIIEMSSTYTDVTQENYLDVEKVCADIRDKFVLINIDDVDAVSNVSKLEEYETKVAELIKANRPVATETIMYDPSNLTTGDITSEISNGGFKVVATSGKEVFVVATGTGFTYNDIDYQTTKSLSMGGSATFGSFRYIEFSTTKKSSITIVAKSTSSDDRIVKMVDSNNVEVTTFAANGAQAITTKNDIDAGTYRIGSANKGIYIYAIIIEYFD